MRQRLDALVGLAIVTACALLLLIGAYWQPKSYNGTPLGLYIAPGDTTTTGYLEADTAAVDTAHFLKASVHRLDGWRAGIDTVRSELDTTALLFVNSAADGRGYAWFANPSMSTATGYYGVYGDWTKTGGASDHNDQFAAFTFHAELDQPGGSVGSFTGFQGYSWLTNGQVGSPDTNRFMIGGKASAQLYGGTVYGTVIGHYGEAVATGNADSVSGNLMGLYSYTQAYHVGGTAYNIFMHDDTGTDYGIYQTGTSPNYLWGLDLGDSLTVAGNVHAPAFYGDGSHLTGITGGSGDTTGLRAEWRVDISESLAVFTPGVSDHGALTGLDDPADHPWALQADDARDSALAAVDTAGLGTRWRADIAESLATFSGGVTDHGDLDSLSRMDPADHPWAMQAADFADSFATAWPDSFTAAMADQIAPALHDTADALRAEVLNSTSFPGAFWRQWWTGPGNYLTMIDQDDTSDICYAVHVDTLTATFVVATNNGLKAYQLVNGLLSRTDLKADSLYTYLLDVGHPGIVVGAKASGGKSFSYSISVAGELTPVAYAQGNTAKTYRLYSDPVTHTSYGLNYASVYSRCHALWNADGTLNSSGNTTGPTISATSFWAYGNTHYVGTLTDLQTFYGDGFSAYTAQDTKTEADSITAVAGNDGYVFALDYHKNRIYSYKRTSEAHLTIKDSLNTPASITALVADDSHLWAGVVGTYSGVLAASVDTAGHMAWTDTLSLAGTVPAWYNVSMRAMAWDGYYLYTGTNGYGTVLYAATDEGITHYNLRAAFHDSTLIQGPLVITADTLPAWPALNGQINLIDGATESHASAGDVAWTTSSSRKLKHIMGTPGPGLGASVLQAIVDMPLYWWRWKEGDTQTQHIGPVAEDFFKVGKKVAPLTATDSTIAGEHEVAALFLAVKELSRRNDSLTVALAASERRMANLERAWGARESTGTKPRRPRLDKPPERPQPDRRRRP